MALLCATWASRDRGDPVAAARYGEQALAAGRDLSALATGLAGLYLAEALYDLGAESGSLPSWSPPVSRTGTLPRSLLSLTTRSRRT